MTFILSTLSCRLGTYQIWKITDWKMSGIFFILVSSPARMRFSQQYNEAFSFFTWLFLAQIWEKQWAWKSGPMVFYYWSYNAATLGHRDRPSQSIYYVIYSVEYSLVKGWSPRSSASPNRNSSKLLHPDFVRACSDRHAFFSRGTIWTWYR